MRRLALIVLLICILPTISFAEESENPKKLKIAAVFGLTGLAAEHGNAMKNGIMLAAENLKADGWQVEIQIEDDQTVPAKTASAVRSLLAKGYRFFVGPTWSFLSKAAEPILKANNAIAITPGGSSLINGGASEVLFNLCPRRDKQIPHVSAWLKKMPYKKAFLLTANGDWGEIHHKVFAEAIKEVGGEIVSEEFYDYGMDAATMQSVLLRAAKKGFDILFTTTSANDIATILKVREQLKMNFAVMTTDTLEDAHRLGLVKGKMLNNTYMTHLPMSERFSKLHLERFGQPARVYSDRAYDAVMTYAMAVEATDGSVAAVRKHLRTNFKMDGMIGEVEFDESGDVVASNYRVSSLN